MDHFVASLPSDRRRKVRRDWRLFDEVGLRAVTVPAADAIESGAPLMSLVKQRYGVPDDARLAA